jgi:hypothetical protein
VRAFGALTAMASTTRQLLPSGLNLGYEFCIGCSLEPDRIVIPACAFFAVLLALSGAAAVASPVRDAGAAIALASKSCPQESVAKKSGWEAALAAISPPEPVNDKRHWNAALDGTSWHVWFGESKKEPDCAFRGAYISADGTSIQCVLTAC